MRCRPILLVVVVVNFYLNRVAHSALRLVSIGALYLKNSLHLELLKYLIKITFHFYDNRPDWSPINPITITFYVVAAVLHVSCLSFFHW